MLLSTISSDQIPAVRRTDLEQITLVLILKTAVKAGRRKKFVYSHIDDRGSINVAIEDSGISVYIRIRKIGGHVFASVDGGRPLLEMIVALSGIGEQGISGDIAVRPCHIGASPAIGRSTGAKGIVGSDNRWFWGKEGATVESGLTRLPDYYVIGQFGHAGAALDKDAGTVRVDGVIVGNRVIDEHGAVGDPQVDARAISSFIAGDDILDDQSLRNTRVDAASGICSGTCQDIPLDDIPFDDRGFGVFHFYAASSSSPVVGDYIVENLRGALSLDEDSATTSSDTEIIEVVGDGVLLY